MATRTEGPRIPNSTRISLAPGAMPTLVRRQAAFAGWAGCMAGMLTLGGLDITDPWFVGLMLGSGAIAAHSRAWMQAPVVLAATVLAAFAAQATVNGTADTLATGATLFGWTVLAAGGAAGLGAVWMDSSPTTGWRAIHGGLGTAAGAGMGWWAAGALIPTGWDPQLVAITTGLITGLVASQGLLAAAIRWHTSHRIPAPGRIKSTLAHEYREPCLRAWQVDRTLATRCPDPNTRDGLGEVAAWVYRLSWTMQNLDQEIDVVESVGLDERIADLQDTAATSEDQFTRDRHQAAAEHLVQLGTHRDALRLEVQRADALRQYATAFLDEARAGLALARVQPGEHVPDRLQDVLTRLRDDAVAGDARRRTVREVAALA